MFETVYAGRSKKYAAEKNIKNTLTSPDSLLTFFFSELSKVKEDQKLKLWI